MNNKQHSGPVVVLVVKELFDGTRDVIITQAELDAFHNLQRDVFLHRASVAVSVFQSVFIKPPKGVMPSLPPSFIVSVQL